MQELSLMEKFADPKMFESLSLSEKLEGAGVTTLMGMGITFAVLVFLWFVIAQMAKFTGGTPKSPKSNSAPTTPSAAPVTSKTIAKVESSPGVSLGESTEIIAVITAALAALQEGAEAKSHLIIRKISRVSGPATSWSSAGAVDAINSRKF